MKNSKLFLTAGLAAVMAIGIFIYALNNSKYEVKFDTDGGNKIESVKVKKNERVEAPKDPKKDGYVFVEWRLDGKTYDFKKKVTKNITLKAKWLPEIYVTVTFDSDGGSEVAPLQVISGTKIESDSITNPTREGYTFAGWLIGDNKYDFNKKVTSDLSLKASWVEGENVVIEDTKTEEKVESKKEDTKTEEKVESKKEDTKTEEKVESKKEDTKTEEKVESKKEDTKSKEKVDTKKSTSKKSDTKNTDTTKVSTTDKTFKVGDKVIITGEYANAIDGDTTGYKIAIGWEREIIAVYENEEYPYQVGNAYGTTGFFKAESLKLKN